ncbi:MAG TPA: sigma-70 family RNA polymerase sigma factor [Verrucomicrobiae bacterium]|nr:sigma-70 family RNA polymerase sigma factor [Verrucomicrobiae bacterium]
MMTTTMSPRANNDADLVSESLAGNRDAFGQIVSRYQSLICSLAYSATGSLGASEDLAQETFITAWNRLRHLREKDKLRAWLCGIARNRIKNSLRREGRDPVRTAETLDALFESASPDPLPHEQAIGKEEEAILWRSLAHIPETYREPLVLFYREHQSIETVAHSLDLSEDTVKQRLSRGRNLLHEQVLAFVERALERSNPGRTFTVGVLAALPALTLSAQAATIGAIAAKGTGTAKTAGALGVGAVFLGPVLAIFGNYLGYRLSLDGATSDPERAFIRRFYQWLLGCIVGFMLLYLALFAARTLISEFNPRLFVLLLIGIATSQAIGLIALCCWGAWRERCIADAIKSEAPPAARIKPAWEYRSSLTLFGWPLVHIRIGGDLAERRTPVKAWIAAGDIAIGLAFAFGGVAMAPISVGGLAIGLLSWGGFAVGMAAWGGLALGGFAMGGLALGWQAFGGCAIAWQAAVGGAAVAKDFALGGFAHAAEANNQIAAGVIEPMPFFSSGGFIFHHMIWLNLIWVIPTALWWWLLRIGNRRNASSQCIR